MRIQFFLGTLILMTLSSCLTIVQSLTTPETILTDNRLVGNWIDPDSKKIYFVEGLLNSPLGKELFTNPLSKDHIQLDKEDSLYFTKHYLITTTEGNLTYLWILALVKIGGYYYINLLPESCVDKNNEQSYKLDQFYTSSIAKLDWKNVSTVTLNFINGDRIKEIIRGGKARIKHEYDPLFGTFVVTASSAELRQFLEKYGNDDRLFQGGDVVELKRKP